MSPRTLRLSAALLGLPAALAAQPPAGPPTAANPITQAFRDIGGTFGGRLVDAFAAIPADRYGYRPTPPQQSVGYIAQHLETANYVLCEALGGAPPPRGPADALADTVKARWPKDTLVTRLRASLEYCGAVFARLSDARLADSVPLGPPGGPRQPVVRARVLGLFVTDLAEHYSQTASYMRLLGMVPPSARPRPER